MAKKKKASGARERMIIVRLSEAEIAKIQKACGQFSDKVGIEIKPGTWARARLVEAAEAELKGKR